MKVNWIPENLGGVLMSPPSTMPLAACLGGTQKADGEKREQEQSSHHEISMDN